MDITSYLSDRRALIKASLSSLSREYVTLLEPAASSAHSVMNRILDFSLSGKMIRGSLVFLGYELFSDNLSPNLTSAASAMELFQSGLLIHDDIMDRDTTRRGMPTLHTRYSEECKDLGSTDPQRAGEALGICAGDICFFLGYEALSRATKSISLASYCAKELAMVGLAQMKDVEWGLTPQIPSPDEVIRMFQHKTARYTFSMPLSIGSQLAGRLDSIDLLESIGEKAGIVFQIRDDELGIYSNQSELGKPIGSDIREGKKTLFYIELMRRSSPSTRAKLNSIFGNLSCDNKDIAYIRSCIEELGIHVDIESMTTRLKAEAKNLIHTLSQFNSIKNEYVQLLLALVEYATQRKF